MRTSPTVPIDVATRESQGNGAVEKSVKTWQGQFRTIKSHLETEIGCVIPHQHKILQWAGWWASQIIYRYAIRHHGRTSYEYVTGHKTKAPITTFGENSYGGNVVTALSSTNTTVSGRRAFSLDLPVHQC